MKSIARLGASGLFILAAAFSAKSANAQAASNLQSSASAELKWSTRTGIPGPTGTILDVSGSGYSFDVTGGADLDPTGPSSSTEPLLLVDMPTATIQASWNNDQTIQLTPVEGTLDDATFQIHHTLAPHIHADITLVGVTLSLDYTATQLVTQVPGAVWKYNGFDKQAFNPWIFGGIAAAVPPDPADLELVSASLNSSGTLGLGLDPSLATGSLSIDGQVEPDNFNYATTSVVFGSSTPVIAKGGQTSIPTVDADFIDLPVLVKGAITYNGHVLIGPAISLNSIGPVGASVLSPACALLTSVLPYVSSLPGAAGCLIDLTGPAQIGNFPYDSMTAPGAVIPVDFVSTTFHIKLPNVKLSATTLDMGDVTLGTSKATTTTINNTGEMDATLAFQSSDPQFVVTMNAGAAAKTAYNLNVTFTPAQIGAASSTITVTSNDPNQPVQTIQVTATGVKEVTSPAPSSENDAGTSDGGGDNDTPYTPSPKGCGCRVVDGESPTAPLAMFGFAMLGLGLIARRRN